MSSLKYQARRKREKKYRTVMKEGQE